MKNYVSDVDIDDSTQEYYLFRISNLLILLLRKWIIMFFKSSIILKNRKLIVRKLRIWERWLLRFQIKTACRGNVLSQQQGWPD